MKTRYQLLLLYILICGVILLRVHVESTGYQSPDSHFYLRVAQNFMDGKGFIGPKTYPFDEQTEESFMAIWPIGYPSLIAWISTFTGLEVFLASKLVNLFFLGFMILLLYLWFGENSLLPAMYFCSFGMLEVYSYTWSEGPFLFVLVGLILLLHKNLTSGANWKTNVLLAITLTSLVLLRYAGLIYFLGTALYVGYLWLFQEKKAAKSVLLTLSIASILTFLYLLLNYKMTGGFFGGEQRIYAEKESWGEFLWLFFDGVLNELFIARNFYWEQDFLFFGLFLIQILVIISVFRHGKLKVDNTSISTRKVLIYSGLFYLISIFILRRLSPFDAFDYRILAPFSMPIFIAILGTLEFEKVKYKFILVGFFVLSLVMTLPKEYLLNSLLDIF